jgi:transposase-like protein
MGSVRAYPGVVFWPAPCGIKKRSLCPYLDWHANPKGDRPRAIIRYGGDRQRREVFRCKLCRKTFQAPPLVHHTRIGFKRYRMVEAMLARGGEKIERYSTIARRLGVDRTTVLRWCTTWGASEEGLRLVKSFKATDLAEGREARLVQDLHRAPFTVSPIDAEPFIKASVGEMRYFAARRRGFDRAWMEDLLCTALDRSCSSVDRRLALEAVAAYLSKKFRAT